MTSQVGSISASESEINLRTVGQKNLVRLETRKTGKIVVSATMWASEADRLDAAKNAGPSEHRDGTF
jgi:hypothetical protein